MTNAEKFKQLFGLYATELWSKSEKDFLTWLNMEYVPDTNVGELIGIQDAIEEIARHDTTDGTVKVFSGREVIEMLKDLPSAQPEVIRCKDCKFQNKGENESESWNLCEYRPWQYVPTDDEHSCSYAKRKTK